MIAKHSQRMKVIIKTKLPLILTILLGLIPLTWLKPGFMIAVGDCFPPFFNSQLTIRTDFFLWNSQDLGKPSTYPISGLYETLWFILQKVGLSTGFIQILVFTFCFMGAGLSMYYLARSVYPKQNWLAFIASVFYMFNMFVVVRGFYHDGEILTYVFLPLLLALLIRIIHDIRQRQIPHKNMLYFAVLSPIVFSLAASNIANVVLILLSLACLVFYYLIFTKGVKIKLLTELLKLTLLVLLLNIWWVIPFINYTFLSGGHFTSEVTNVSSWSWTHARASFLNLFWLNPTWGWRPEYVPYIERYSNPALIFITFIPAILGFSALLFRSKKHLFNTYVALLILGFLFLAKGLHEPLGSVNMFLYEHILGMFIFRDPTLKFTMVVMPLLALLVGYATMQIAALVSQSMPKGKLKIGGVVPFFCLLLVTSIFIGSSFPLVTGQIVKGETDSLLSSYVKFPDYWYETSDWINHQDGDFKVLLTPNDDFYQVPFTWGYYGVREFPSRLICKPTIQVPVGYKVNEQCLNSITEVYKAIEDNNASEFQRLLDLMNVKYILQRNDIQYDFPGRQIISPAAIKSFFGTQPNISLVDTFGELDIYEYANFKPHISIVEGETDTLADTFTSTENSVNMIKYQKVNPTKYKVMVNASQPFMLSFAEAYDPLWVARVDGKEYESVPLYSVINGFWIENTGELEITLEYKPQRWFYYGAIVSSVSLVGALGYLGWGWRRGRRLRTRD